MHSFDNFTCVACVYVCVYVCFVKLHKLARIWLIILVVGGGGE